MRKDCSREANWCEEKRRDEGWESDGEVCREAELRGRRDQIKLKERRYGDGHRWKQKLARREETR